MKSLLFCSFSLKLYDFTYFTFFLKLGVGDFEEVYGGESDPDEPQHGLWDAVLTCFFIDTVGDVFPFWLECHFLFDRRWQAKNIVNYLRIIHKILAPGGIWINLGPLLWHWENNTSGDMSIELDLEEIKQLAGIIGFEISVRFFDSSFESLTVSRYSSTNER